MPASPSYLVSHCSERVSLFRRLARLVQLAHCFLGPLPYVLLVPVELALCHSHGCGGCNDNRTNVALLSRRLFFSSLLFLSSSVSVFFLNVSPISTKHFHRQSFHMEIYGNVQIGLSRFGQFKMLQQQHTSQEASRYIGSRAFPIRW